MDRKWSNCHSSHCFLFGRVSCPDVHHKPVYPYSYYGEKERSDGVDGQPKKQYYYTVVIVAPVGGGRTVTKLAEILIHTSAPHTRWWCNRRRWIGKVATGPGGNPNPMVNAKVGSPNSAADMVLAGIVVQLWVRWVPNRDTIHIREQTNMGCWELKWFRCEVVHRNKY